MSFDPKNIVVIGASGAIGKAFIALFQTQYPNAEVRGFSRNGPNFLDYKSEASIKQASEIASQNQPIDLVVVTTGILHDNEILPEKSLKDLSAEKFHHIFEANLITPALIAKYFLCKLNKESTSIFAVLSARVGSISDNHLGGWYSYRASKAALNMVVKNAAIEIARNNKQAIIVGLHPGTVDSNLSKPFQKNIPKEKLFTAKYAVKKMQAVLENLSTEKTGKCFAWDGEEILP